ncbi:uncharacterized protein F4822DRAFT_445374 [Hypoxylon trugodes]|uniref:uncharacterized protein n=1 Tax=Hypoxylon trugodes TaxID=326681 RepID=UPI00218DFDA6|nr:uncharacterized protein F4822DRAFT_445374 [Hypoxylon trugodes]KAI1385427.1 hypothetical protein F4822DRAFT_445374 [Hypoxylon trugodes]
MAYPQNDHPNLMGEDNIDLLQMGLFNDNAIGHPSRPTGSTGSVRHSYTHIRPPTLPSLGPIPTGPHPAATSGPREQNRSTPYPRPGFPGEYVNPTATHGGTERPSPVYEQQRIPRVSQTSRISKPLRTPRPPRGPQRYTTTSIPPQQQRPIQGRYTDYQFAISNLQSSPSTNPPTPQATTQTPSTSRLKLEAAGPAETHVPIKQEEEVKERAPRRPYGLDQLEAAVLRLEAEEKQRKAEEAAKKEEEVRIEAERKENGFRWPGDTSDFPAEALADYKIPGCELRAKAVCIGHPRDPELSRLRVSVFAMRPEGSRDVLFKIAKDGSSIDEIHQGYPIKWEDVRVHAYFQGMSEFVADHWIRHLLAMVPGVNDSIMKWT